MPDPAGSRIPGALKYDGWSAVAGSIGIRLAGLVFPADVVRERVALFPVPLTPDRERERGCNQAKRLAEAVGAA